jgi:TetR/AcrR family transcriptional regulator, transcriptional repressor for nem operon
MQNNDTYEQIMEIAKELIQRNGYNGFSYADIALHVGIRKPTIHYYFPNKSDLVKMVVIRYRENFCQMLRNIEQQTSIPHNQIEMYVKLYLSVLEKSDTICLCGMLSAEFSTLPEDVSQEVQKFFSENEKWLINVIRLIRKHAEKDVDLKNISSEQNDAWLLLSGLEGAMLLARTSGGSARFSLVMHRLLKALNLVSIENSLMIKELDEIKKSSLALTGGSF